MYCFLASLVSTALGIGLFECFGARLIDSFLLTIGTSVYAINRYGLSELEHMRLSQQLALKVLYALLILVAGITALVGLATLPFWLIQLDAYSTQEMVLASLGGAVPPCMVYLFLRRKPGKSDYSAGKQAFYYLTLGVPAVGHVVQLPSRRAVTRCTERSVIVTGLARAGTTALLKHLSLHPQLWSFTYRHMPLLTASPWWVKINRAGSDKVERSHKDGLMVDLDSPEAFDEYFWRTILKEHYYRDGCLYAHDLEPSHIAQFEQYISPHLRAGMVYLSKNNNFLLRADSFLRQRPDCVMALVFRHPLEHAHSLLRQHRLQSDYQRQNQFVRDYMDMLGHHEFGLGRRDFVFADEDFEFTDPMKLNYWLEQWQNYYRYALSLEHSSIVFISNQMLAAQPNECVDTILGRVGLTRDIEYLPSAARSSEIDSSRLSAMLLRSSAEIYAQLKELAAVAELSAR